MKQQLGRLGKPTTPTASADAATWREAVTWLRRARIDVVQRARLLAAGAAGGMDAPQR